MYLMHLWVEGDTHRLGTMQTHASESRECEVLSRSYVKFVFSLLLPLGLTFCHASSSLPGYWWMRTQQHKVGNGLDSFLHVVTVPWNILQEFNARFKYSRTGLTKWRLEIRCIWGDRTIIQSLIVIQSTFIIWILLGNSSVKNALPRSRK